MAGRAVFVDIDGTLISGSSGPFDDDIAAIEKARLLGTQFFLCTGRSTGHIPPVFLNASWKDGIVAAGGAHVILGGKTLYHNRIPIPVLCEITALFLAKGKQCRFLGARHVYEINRSGGKIPITSERDFAEKYSGADVSMITVDLSMGNEERVFLEKYFDIYPQIPHFDCFIKGEGKAKGMRMILDNVAMDRKDSVAIGDSANDFDMFEYAGTGIAVGNACDELKAKASWISAPVGEGGVAKALEHLGLC